MTNVDSSKNILIFADGTGNEGGLLPDESRTNVYKLYRATRVNPETAIDPRKQIAFYIPGIGTPPPGTAVSFADKCKSTIAEAVGGGLTKRIAECYAAIISVWQPGDRIYLFGFSRGAYTARCVAHVVEQLGIPTTGSDGLSISLDPKKLFAVARSAVKILYRLGMTTEDCDRREQQYLDFRRQHNSVHGADTGAIPYFIGVWETVAAVGWNHFFPTRIEEHLTQDVMYVRHAMAIDEYRKDYPRARWGSVRTVRQGKPDEPQPFEQVWFAGNHSDIGGSYPENESRLSDITLDWVSNFISNELPVAARVSIDRRLLNLHPSSDGMMHDECMVGVDNKPGLHWRKKIRPVDSQGDLHSSVLERLALPKVRNFDSYAPYRPANLRYHPKAKSFWESPV